MIEPSSIRHPEGYKPITKEVKPGLYVIENAYEGEYVYFENDSFPHEQSSSEVINDSEKTSETVELEGIGEKMRQRLGTTEPKPTKKPQITQKYTSEIDA
ncbi:hypothetical protein [Crocosphaera sp. XPORK-15E]|uniref:hypothetical protein n=1 Tax=Crocosphaera sp. XPORK-15E TaxID=3110247 RepID=UPI002B20A644|nr:hypothetical protein [Crocosphaera sp. XPORK-15E]MEA5537141.1 hypothetical protein [Crocosphaera sp. XPORK-15E]